MLLNNVITFVMLLNIIQRINTHFLNNNSAKNRNYLIDIIKMLHNYDVATDNVNGNTDKLINEENSLELSDEEKEKKLQEMLWLLKKNYNAKKQHDEIMKNPINSGSRLYFIKNPEVLEEYKNYLRKKKNIPSTYEDIDRNYGKGDEKEYLKRRAEFRTGSSDQSDDDNDFDREESQDGKDAINERSTETTQTLTDSVQDKDLIVEEILENTSKIVDLEVNKELRSNNEKTKEESFESHNIRAQEENSDNLVRREKVEWSDTNDKTVAKEINNNKNEKSYTSRKNKQKNNDKKEKLFDDYNQDTTNYQYKPRPKISYRKPKNEGKKDYFSYGRTSIPFIGKKGIYEDK